MHGVGPSTVLGGRYAAQRRLEQLPGAERWSAHDQTLERDVVVVCFAEDAPQAATALDAARRAAGLDNHRLVRVLDVGRSDGIAFFVEESLPDAHTLTQLVEEGGLPAEEARRIAGEAASALESARGRGLHHLALTPSSVLRGSDGVVKVRGLATAAALAGSEDLDSPHAARIDAIGVVAIAYAALTSRWPLPGTVAGLDPAPRVVGGVPSPSEIAAGVPGDLDALCRLTLNEDEGPTTPGDFATQIAPWSRTQVGGLGSAGAAEAVSGVEKTIALPLGELRPATPGSAEPTQRFSIPLERQDPEGAEGDLGASGAPATGAALAGAATAGAAAAAGAAAVVGSALGTAGQAAGQAATTAAHRVGVFAKAAADKAAERRTQRQAAHERADQRRMSLDDALLIGDEPIQPPVPMLPVETASPPSRDQSKLVLVIVAVFLVVVMALAFWGASQIGSGSHLNLGASTPRPTVTVTAPATTVGGSHGSSPSQAPAGAPIPILSATGFDPEGDNNERNGEAPRTFDGNPATFWSSEGYSSPAFGGLKKGVGVLLDFGQPRTLHKVALILPTASDVSVFVGPNRSLDGATQVGSSSGKSGAITLNAPGGSASGQYLIVWFTQISLAQDGRYRATLAEVTAS